MKPSSSSLHNDKSQHMSVITPTSHKHCLHKQTSLHINKSQTIMYTATALSRLQDAHVVLLSQALCC